MTTAFCDRTCTHIGFIVVVLVACLLPACGRQKEANAAGKSEPPPVRAAVIRVERSPFAATVAVTGTLVSPSSVTVKAETYGRIVRFPKQEGDHVAAGEPVAWVDDINYKLAVRQAETTVVIAQTALERARVGRSHSHSEYVRAQNLLQSGGITEKDFKAAELAERDGDAQVALATAQAEQAQVQLAVAKKRLDDSIVRAPVMGEIQSKISTEGSYVEPPTAVFSVVDNSRLELESMVVTADLSEIRSGQKVKFSVNTFPGQQFEGRVIDVNPAVQADTRSAKVRVRVDNASRRLKAGMFVQGEISTGIYKDNVQIPASAAWRDDRSAKSSYVFVVENNRLTRRNIDIGRERDSALEILEGLRIGDLVVAEQSIEIAEGVRVAPEVRTQRSGEQHAPQ